MTGQTERSAKKKQPSRSKARGLNSSNEASNVGTPEAESSWIYWKSCALQAEPSWQALVTHWKIDHHGAQLGVNMSQHGPTWGYLGAILGLICWACLDQLGPTWANMGPTWGQLGPTWGQLGASLAQHGPTWGQLGANLGSTWGQLGPTWGNLGQLGVYFGQHGPT